MPNQNFVILSNQLENDILNLPNCKLINGSFAKQGLSDIELKNLYNESIMTIIPLKNSIQPSEAKCCTTINGLWNTCSDYRNFWFLG